MGWNEYVMLHCILPNVICSKFNITLSNFSRMLMKLCICVQNDGKFCANSFMRTKINMSSYSRFREMFVLGTPRKKFLKVFETKATPNFCLHPSNKIFKFSKPKLPTELFKKSQFFWTVWKMVLQIDWYFINFSVNLEKCIILKLSGCVEMFIKVGINFEERDPILRYLKKYLREKRVKCTCVELTRGKLISV